MNIALVHPSLGVRGGAENVVLWLADGLHRRGHRVTLITSEFEAALYGSPHALPYQVVTLPLGGYSADLPTILRAGLTLSGVLAGFDWINPHNFPAYIWTHVARLANPRIGPILWFCEEPVRWFYPEICNPHVVELRRRTVDDRPAWRRRASAARARLRNWRLEPLRVLDRWTVPRLDGVIANSEFIAGQIRQIFHRDAIACRLGIPRGRFPDPPVQTPPREQPYLLTVSRLFPEKNMETVLAAVRMLKDRGQLPFRKFVIVGDGPLRAGLEATAVTWGLAEVVEFTGAVPDQALAAFYRGAELVVYLPLDETFGLVILEAALFRKAVIGSNHGGPAEIIDHGVSGLQVDPLDPAAIADAIAAVLQDSIRREVMGEAAYKQAMREYTFDHFVDRFEEAVQTVLGR